MLVRGRLLIDPARPPAPGWVRIDSSRIAEIGDGDPPRSARADAGGPSTIITPGFIDAHLHVPQFGSVGCDGMALLDWLERVVYPAERWWGSAAAASLTRAAARTLLEHGTLGFAGYLSSHADASLAAMEVLAASGLRCVVGRVAMDHGAPEDLTREDRARAGMTPRPGPIVPAPAGVGARVQSSANPRFAPACSEELLAEIGWLRRERPDLFVQTHLAESTDEIERVRELFPLHASYTSVYDRCGLLGDRTLLAHCCHLSKDDWTLLAARRCVAVHCPTANVFLRAGLFDLDAATDHGVRLALGSDIAAGPDVAMPRVARAFIETAKVRAMTAPAGRAVRIPTPAEAWRLITRGNAEALAWADGGRLEVGGAADLLLLRVPETWLDEHLVGRLIYNWSSALVEGRIVRGRSVDPASI